METYYGHIRTMRDALIVIEACCQDLLPRVRHRLSDRERCLVRSGTVFVWDESETGMRRWTDGRSWSPSRSVNGFLSYRELAGRRQRTSMDVVTPTARNSSTRNISRREFRYQPDGLIKRALSAPTTSGRRWHLISYYRESTLINDELISPSIDPRLAHIQIPLGVYINGSMEQNDTITTGGMGRTVPNQLAPITQFIGNANNTNKTSAVHLQNHGRVQQWTFVDGTSASNSVDSTRQSSVAQSQHASNTANTSYSMQTPVVPSNQTAASMATNAKRTFPDTLHQHFQMQYQLQQQPKPELTPRNTADDLQQDNREGIKRRGLDHSKHGQIVVRLPGTRHPSILNIPNLNSPNRLDTHIQSFYHFRDVNSLVDHEGRIIHDNGAKTSTIVTSSMMHPLTNREATMETVAFTRASSTLKHEERLPISALPPNRPMNDGTTGHYNDHAGPLIQSHRARELNGLFSNYTIMNKNSRTNEHTRPRGDSAYASVPSTGIPRSQSTNTRALHADTLQVAYTTSQDMEMSNPRQVNYLTNHRNRSSSIDPSLAYNSPVSTGVVHQHSSRRRPITGELSSILVSESYVHDEADTNPQASPYYPTSHHSSLSPLLSSRRNRMPMHDNLHGTILPESDMPIHNRGIRAKSIPATTDERFVYHHREHSRINDNNHSNSNNNNSSSNNNNNDSHIIGDNNLRLPSLQGWLRGNSLSLPKDVTRPMQSEYSQAWITTNTSVSPMHSRYYEHGSQETASSSLMMAPTTIWHSGTLDTITCHRRPNVNNISSELGMSTRQQQASAYTGSHIPYRSISNQNEQVHHPPRAVLPRLSTENLVVHSAQPQTASQSFITSSALPATLERNTPPSAHRHRVEHSPAPVASRLSIIPTSVHATSGPSPHPVVPQMITPTAPMWSAEDRRQMDQLHKSLQL